MDDKDIKFRLAKLERSFSDFKRNTVDSFDRLIEVLK